MPVQVSVLPLRHSFHWSLFSSPGCPRSNAALLRGLSRAGLGQGLGRKFSVTEQTFLCPAWMGKTLPCLTAVLHQLFLQIYQTTHFPWMALMASMICNQPLFLISFLNITAVAAVLDWSSFPKFKCAFPLMCISSLFPFHLRTFFSCLFLLMFQPSFRNPSFSPSHIFEFVPPKEQYSEVFILAVLVFMYFSLYMQRLYLFHFGILYQHFLFPNFCIFQMLRRKKLD